MCILGGGGGEGDMGRGVMTSNEFELARKLVKMLAMLEEGWPQCFL